MEKKQTSVEWLADKIDDIATDGLRDYIETYLQQAKKMHNQEIINAYEMGWNNSVTSNFNETGEQYYNETFK